MKTTGYREDLKGWPMDTGPILSMPPEAKEADVIAEAERLAALQVIVEGTVDVPSVTEVGPAIDERTPDEKLDAAITEYIVATGAPLEAVATRVVERMPIERKCDYLSMWDDVVAAEIDAKAIEDAKAAPIDTGGVVEKPIDVVRKVG